MYNYIIHKEKEKQRHHRFHTISVYNMETNLDNQKTDFFFNKEGSFIIKNSHDYKILYVDYYDIWLKYRAEFEFNYPYIKNLIQSMVREA